MGGEPSAPPRCTTGSSARPRPGCWKRRGAAGKRRWEQPTRPRAPQEGRTPASRAGRPARVKVFVAEDTAMSNARVGDTQEEMQTVPKLPVPRAAHEVAGRIAALCPLPAPLLARPRAAQPGSGRFQPKPRRSSSRPGSVRWSSPIPRQLGVRKDCADFFKCQTIRKKLAGGSYPLQKNSNTRMGIRGADVICANPTHLFGL